MAGVKKASVFSDTNIGIIFYKSHHLKPREMQTPNSLRVMKKPCSVIIARLL